MCEEMKCPKCGENKKVKRGFVSGKQRFLCKNCGCNFTQSHKKGYCEDIKREAIRYYLEGIGFRKIERLLKISHVSVINWVKKEAEKLKKN